MAAQGEQGQEGIDLEIVESMAQDGSTIMQVDNPPQPNTEFVMGAAAGAAAREHPQQQAPLPVPSETAIDRGGSASSGSFDWGRFEDSKRG